MMIYEKTRENLKISAKDDRIILCNPYAYTYMSYSYIL